MKYISRQNRKFGESCVLNGLLAVCGTAQFPSTLRKSQKLKSKIYSQKYNLLKNIRAFPFGKGYVNIPY